MRIIDGCTADKICKTISRADNIRARVVTVGTTRPASINQICERVMPDTLERVSWEMEDLERITRSLRPMFRARRDGKSVAGSEWDCIA